MNRELFEELAKIEEEEKEKSKVKKSLFEELAEIEEEEEKRKSLFEELTKPSHINRGMAALGTVELESPRRIMPMKPRDYAGIGATALDSLAFGIPKKFSPKLKKYIEDFGEENKTYKKGGELIGDIANMAVLPTVRPLKAISSLLGKTKYGQAAWKSIKPVAEPAINAVRNFTNERLIGKVAGGALENAAYGGAYGGLRAYGEDKPITEGLKTGAMIGTGLGAATRLPSAISNLFNKSKKIQGSLRRIYPGTKNASEAQEIALRRADEALKNDLDMIANANVPEMSVVRGAYFDSDSSKARELIEEGKDRFNKRLEPRVQKVIDDMFPRTPDANDFSIKTTNVGKKAYATRLAKASKEAAGKEIFPKVPSVEEVKKGTGLLENDPLLQNAKDIVESKIGETENLITHKIGSLEYWDEVYQKLGELEYGTKLSDAKASMMYGAVRDKVGKELNRVTNGMYTRRVAQAGRMYKGTQSIAKEGKDFDKGTEALKRNPALTGWDPKVAKDYYDRGFGRKSKFGMYKKAYKAGARKGLETDLINFSKAQNANLMPKVLNSKTQKYLEPFVDKKLLDKGREKSDILSNAYKNYNKFSNNSATAENIVDSQKLASFAGYPKNAVKRALFKLALMKPELSSEQLVKYLRHPKAFKKAITTPTNLFQRSLEDNPRILESVLRKIKINEELREEKR
jgi:hypothetical protein